MISCKKIEKFFYSFGISCVNVASSQVGFIRKNVSQDFKEKEMIDIGCGDGKMTKILAEIFKAKNVKAIDCSPALVKSAQRRGIKAKVQDIEKQEIKGELATMWGVLHHLTKKQKVLKNLAKNFKYVFIREEIKHFKIFEMGKLMTENELESLYSVAFKKENIELLKYKKALFLFYRNPSCIEQSSLQGRNE